jgi:hypothetical protein
MKNRGVLVDRVSARVGSGMGSSLNSCLRIAIAGIFVVAPRLFYDLEFHGLEHDTGEPRTYLAISHKRDLDAMAPLPALLAHRGWRALTHDVHFAMRGDGFEPGFLARMAPHPRLFAHALRPLSVAPILRGVGIHPLLGLHQRPGESWIRELLRSEGDMRAGDVLAPETLRALSAAASEPLERVAESQLSQVLAWHYAPPLQPFCGAEIFTGPARRRAERRLLYAAKANLKGAADWLWKGGSLYSAPEARLSTDGRLSPISGGFHRLLHAAPPDTRVQPIAIVYDAMTVQRRRMFVDVAPAIEGAPTLPPRELDALLRRAWLRAMRFTCTQLGSGFLVEHSRTADAAFTSDELAVTIRQRAAKLVAAGRHVDARLLFSDQVRQRVAGFLAFAARRGLVRPEGTDTWRAIPEDLSITVPVGEVGYRKQPLAYAWNEYRELLALDAATGSAFGEPHHPDGAQREAYGA